MKLTCFSEFDKTQAAYFWEKKRGMLSSPFSPMLNYGVALSVARRPELLRTHR